MTAETKTRAQAIERFREGFGGAVITPGAAPYEEARKIWNGTIDKRPAVIIQPRTTAEVAEAVDFAREAGFNASVRGGGHNVAGGALNDGGVVIDLSQMRAVEVNPEKRTARVQGGARLNDLDAATQEHGLAVPVGVVSETGVAGLTLGGGVGHMRRKYGLTIDNLLSAEVVTADGKVLTASEQENADLFWALRGGGQGAAVVTSFQFRAHPVGPEVFLLFVIHPFEQARELLQFFRQYTAEAPDEVSLLAAVMNVPDHEEFGEARGRKGVGFLAAYTEDPAEGERVFEPVRRAATPLVDLSDVIPWTHAQAALDEDYPDGQRYYWKSTNLKGLDDATIDAILEVSDYPSPLTTVDIWHHGGAISRPEQDTAFAHRDVPYGLTFEANWPDPKDDDANIKWARDGWDRMQEFSSGIYVNFPGHAENADFGRLAYGANWDRLQAIRKRYDPQGLFV